MMATLWTICGAGRGVGKTHLALALCEALPDAVYVKLGGGRPKPDKPDGLLRTERELEAFIEEHSASRRHIVAEANPLARKGKGDVIIFIDVPPGHEDPRQDREELRASSHIAISADANTRNWKNVLRARLSDPELADRLLGIILEQQRFLCGPEIRVRSRIWFMVGTQRVFGSGLARLLESIDRLGSLTEAAKATKISYRRAWDLIKEAEGGLGSRLIIPRAGGAGGGGSVLSEDGRRLLEVFKVLSRDVAALVDTRFAELQLERHR